MDHAANVAQVPDMALVPVAVNGRQLLLANIRGQYFACENRCPHQGSPMTGAHLDQAGYISCPRHNYRFNLRTGACINMPRYTLRVFPVSLEGDNLLVDLDG